MRLEHGHKIKEPINLIEIPIDQLFPTRYRNHILSTWEEEKRYLAKVELS